MRYSWEAIQEFLGPGIANAAGSFLGLRILRSHVQAKRIIHDIRYTHTHSGTDRERYMERDVSALKYNTHCSHSSVSILRILACACSDCRVIDFRCTLCARVKSRCVRGTLSCIHDASQEELDKRFRQRLRTLWRGS